MDIVIGFTFKTCRVTCMVFKNKTVFSLNAGSFVIYGGALIFCDYITQAAEG